MQAAEVKIKGIVQGVGFRPFIHRLVRERGLKGTIRNTSSGVTMELEGEEESIRRFLADLPTEAPPLAVIESITKFGKIMSPKQMTRFYSERLSGL